MRDLTEEELALAPDWATHYLIDPDYEEDVIYESEKLCWWVGLDEPMQNNTFNSCVNRPIKRKPFDISEHNWNGVNFEGVDSDGDITLRQSYYVDSFYINKQDAITIAKHFKLTAEDLK